MTDTMPKRPGLLLALTPIVCTLIILGVQIFAFDDFSPHLPLALGVMITAIVGWSLGHTWESIREGAFHVIHVSMPSVSVLIVVGMLIGVWISSGTVPLLIYYGLGMLSPSIFLVASMIICSIISVTLGTSWGTIGTVGLALMGIGAGFGVPVYFTAGAVVSGAFFGDKISPLSDTTNLAPAVTGTNVFDHIKNMMPTTIPAMLIAVVIYTIMGFVLLGNESDVSFDRISSITTAIDQQFNLSPWLLLPALLVIVLALTKQPPIPTLFIGVLAGGVTAYFAQGVGLHDFFTYANYGYTMDTGVKQIDTLLTRGGIQSMMWTISLILIALAFGGTLERTGCLQTIIHRIMTKISTFTGLQTAAICTSMATNVVAGDPYLSIALPGRMYAPVYRGMGYSTLNLSRGCEEGGTLMSPLIPWNAGGAFVIGTLGLLAGGETINLLYIPFAFACWLAPVFGILYAYTGWFSPKATDAEREKWKTNNESILTREDLIAFKDKGAAETTHV